MELFKWCQEVDRVSKDGEWIKKWVASGSEPERKELGEFLMSIMKTAKEMLRDNEFRRAFDLSLRKPTSQYTDREILQSQNERIRLLQFYVAKIRYDCYRETARGNFRVVDTDKVVRVIRDISDAPFVDNVVNFCEFVNSMFRAIAFISSDRDRLEENMNKESKKLERELCEVNKRIKELKTELTDLERKKGRIEEVMKAVCID